MLGIRRDPTNVQRSVPQGKVEWLGRSGDFDFGILGGREYAVDIRATADPADYTRQRDEILVVKVEREVIDGSGFEHHRTYRGWPVERGTFAARQAKMRKPAGEKPMRAWDALASLSVMQRRDPLRMPINPGPSNVHLGALSAQLGGKLAKLPVMEVGGNEPPDRSPAAIIAFLASRGVELTLARGRLVVRSRSPIQFDDRELIEKAEELIVGVLRGSPVMCSACAEPAVSIVFPHAPMCAEHLKG